MFLKISIGLFLFAGILSTSDAQTGAAFYISSTGSDLNNGSSAQNALKTTQRLNQLAANQPIPPEIRFGAGQLFREAWTPGFDFSLSTYPVPGSRAIFDGSANYTDSLFTDTSCNSCKYALVYHQGFFVNNLGNYSYLHVVEVDTLLEKTMPYSARKPLRLARNLSELASIPGSFYHEVSLSNPLLVRIHPSNDQLQGKRYEIARLSSAVNAKTRNVSQLENCWIRGYGAGEGMIRGGANSTLKNMVFGPGGPIHHIVLRSGVIRESLFFRAAMMAGEFAVVFYDVEGFHQTGTITRSIFLDVEKPVYMHHSYGSNFNRLQADQVFSFADPAEPGYFMAAGNCDTLEMNRCYATDHLTGYVQISPKIYRIQNSVFRNVQYGVQSNAGTSSGTIRNTLILNKNTQPGSGIALAAGNELELDHSILHVQCNNSALATGFVSGSGLSSTHIKAHHSIFVADIAGGNAFTAAQANTGNGAGTGSDAWDYNVYVLLRGSDLRWKVSNPSSNQGSVWVNGFEQWKIQSGQDQHSLFFDLRNDPRGLKAIFYDPDRGDYTLALTPEADQIRRLTQAGMTEPLTCFPEKPSAETAAELLNAGLLPDWKACQNPCLGSQIRVNHSLHADPLKRWEVSLTGSISQQQNIRQILFQRAAPESAFEVVQSVLPHSDSLYHFSDPTVLPGTDYRYRIGILNGQGDTCFSDPVRVSTIPDDRAALLFPNPSSGTVQVLINRYQGPVTATIYSASGQQLLQLNYLAALNEAHPLFQDPLPAGVYLVQIRTRSGNFTHKLIIQ